MRICKKTEAGPGNWPTISFEEAPEDFLATLDATTGRARWEMLEPTYYAYAAGLLAKVGTGRERSSRGRSFYASKANSAAWDRSAPPNFEGILRFQEGDLEGVHETLEAAAKLDWDPTSRQILSAILNDPERFAMACRSSSTVVRRIYRWLRDVKVAARCNISGDAAGRPTAGASVAVRAG